ncbi:MAG: replication initiator protein [Microviridae sp.]|nr:MAG: replication initiator protein [Microviridae sp.]
MSVCYSPMLAYRNSDGNIIFSDPKNNAAGDLKLPCGQCLGCRLNHAEGWAIRMVHEAQCHEENCFITLTYNDENLPENKNLDYSHVTKFIKRLRKVLSVTKVKIKYYRVGEYGENFSRPHYHIILFGFDFTAKLRYKNKENIHTHWRTKNNNKYYTSTLLTDLWGLGHAELGDVNYNTCMYVAKYVTKRVNGRLKDSHYQRTNSDGEITTVEPERSSMSRKEAIGKQWLERYWTDIYPSDHAIHDGRKLKTPKYYDRWLEKNNLELYESVKIQRESSIHEQNQIDLSRLHEVKILNQNQFIRELDGTTNSTTELDKKILKYHKDQIEVLHKRKKNATKNVHSL